MNLTEKQKDKLVEEAGNSLCGHIAMPDVTAYIVEFINKEFKTDFEDTLELLEFVQEAGFDVWECPACGWYNEWLTDLNSEDEELLEPVCADCADSAEIKEEV